MNEQQTTPGDGFNLVRWSVEHPYTVISFFLAMIVLGIIAIGYLMPKRFMPYVESPMLGIITEMEGLSAEEMEMYFASPIEQKMVNVKNVRYIRSVSQDGFSMVVLEFNYGSDMKAAQTEVQSLMSSVQAELPAMGANLKPSWILPIDPLNIPVLTLSLTGDESKGWTLARLRDLADNEVTNRLKAVSRSVWSVSPYGGHRRQLVVNVDREKLAAYGLSIMDVREAIDENNLSMPAGRVTNETSETILRVDSLARGADEVREYPIRAVGDGIVKIGDVANVTDSIFERRSAFHHLEGTSVHEGIAINVLQNPDASSPETIDAVMRTVAELEEAYPGITFRVAYDNAGFVDTLFENMWEELALAILLTGIAVLLFLGEVRGTLIALTAIPTSLAMALLGMSALGMSLNSSTLIGLLIAIGRLVDDAIIDIHAVERHMRMGKDRVTATIDGITEVRRSVLAATIVLIVALIPLMLSGGITQLMFVGLCWPIIFGLIFSYLVSMTLTAVLCSRFMQQPSERRSTWFSRLVLQPFDRGLGRMEAGYERLVRYMLRNPVGNFVRIGLTVIAGFTFYYFIGSEMMPLADVGQASMQMEMKPGTSFAETEKAVRKLEEIMIEEGGRQGWLKHAAIELGVEGGPGMTGGTYFTGYGMKFVNGAMAMLTFTDKDSGRPNIWKIIDTIHHRAMSEIPGIRRIQFKEMGSDLMATALAPVALVIYGRDLEILDKIGKETLRIAKNDVIDPRRKKHDLAQPFLSWEMSQPTATLVVDRAKALRHGLTPAMIADQAYYALRGGLATSYYRLPNKRPTTVRIRYQDDQRATLDDLDGMFVAGMNGEQVPLRELVRLETRPAPSMIEHDQLRRVISIGGYYRLDGRPSMDLTMDLQMQALAKINWPQGYGIEARGDMTQMMSSFRVMLLGLIVALILMYLILVAQFGGFLQPLQMIFSIPLELSGVFFLLWLVHQHFSTVSILGIIILSGMDVVTAILLIDLIIHFRATGLPRNEAIAKAAPQRLRPILMTSLITIFVMAQVAFWPKSGLDAYQPLGTVVIGGLLVGTVLSLLDIPVMHAIVDDILRWCRVHILKHDPKTLPPVEATDEN
ncbi:MAG: Multidrug resistance protein MdtB [Fimbriimonadales bacterium]|nr:Multidrug resistance protein MdtB [Fimbriimonadales bacterium]